MLDHDSLADAVRALAVDDPDLAAVVDAFGVPPLWEREQEFATLLLLILEQQVSLASARAAFDRLAARLGGAVTPAGLLALDDVALRADGFSRQKTRYARLLADAIDTGALDLPALAGLDDTDARAALMALPGIGPWTADVYLVMALRRADAFPSGDLALQVAAQEVKRLPVRPRPDDLDAVAERWRPHRAAAARILWLHYLGTRSRL
ncbi:MAG: DNA-3-methyladenine glycosylase 2 family protein [Actinobacteria bacterium]|nr:DNA-3-methyladenine glycosylase 2 family protein [Actinomycetota bacterium]